MLNSKNKNIGAIVAACAIMMATVPIVANAVLANYLNNTVLNWTSDMKESAPYATSKPHLYDSFECRHNYFVDRYKDSSGMYNLYNPYDSLYPNCIIGKYNYCHPDHPLPYFHK